ncbi:MAG: hypothetical protein AAFX93_20040 [Verrucomicrobiota bacterium]
MSKIFTSEVTIMCMYSFTVSWVNKGFDEIYGPEPEIVDFDIDDSEFDSGKRDPFLRSWRQLKKRVEVMKNYSDEDLEIYEDVREAVEANFREVDIRTPIEEYLQRSVYPSTRIPA